MPFDVPGDRDELKFNLIFFTLLVAYINRRMFEIGLPIRGAIHIGDVVLGKRSFAGKAVMDTHRLAGKCQVAGTVVSPEAHTFILDTFSEPKGYHFMYMDVMVETDIPTGTKQLSKLIVGYDSEKMNTLCWFYLQMGQKERFVIPSDLNRYITEKFSAHEKRVDDAGVKMKIFNTEKLFRDWQAALKLKYQQHVGIKLQTPL